MEGISHEMLGANTRSELADLEHILQKNLRKKIMDSGATLIDPNTVYFSVDTQIGKDVVIYPNVYFGEKVIVEDNVKILPYSYLERVHLKKGDIIGPFAGHKQK